MLNELASPEMIEKVLELIPQQRPFRFIDEIVELSENHVVGKYRFREDEFFYEGHFPGKPTTPGVILIEAMAQVSVVAQGLYKGLRDGADMNRLTLFTECEVEFSAVVNPGDEITIYGEMQYFRKGKVKSKARIELADGTVAASGVLAGVGVKRE